MGWGSRGERARTGNGTPLWMLELLVVLTTVGVAACSSTPQGQPVGSFSAAPMVLETASPAALLPNELPDLTGSTKQAAIDRLHALGFRNLVFIPAGSASDGMRVKATSPSPLEIVASKADAVTLILVP